MTIKTNPCQLGDYINHKQMLSSKINASNSARMSIVTTKALIKRKVVLECKVLLKRKVALKHKATVKMTSVHSVKSNIRWAVMLGSLLNMTLVSGCTDRVGAVNDALLQIQESDSQAIEPQPQHKLVEDYAYRSDNDTRSPFVPSSFVNRPPLIVNTPSVVPDSNRTKQPLERYELSQLTYKGVIVDQDGETFGLVQGPDGVVSRTRVGEYMGLQNGRIVEFTPNQINLIEIVPDNRVGFIEKPASVVAPV